jgi:hypothetical protein
MKISVVRAITDKKGFANCPVMEKLRRGKGQAWFDFETKTKKQEVLND